jgi:NAD(P)-dependent dehydrogenase (short-subunit alcohol dehydrogenase family)
MLLNGKNAILYGGGGAIGGAVARAFAREGATVFLTGRHRAALDAVAKDIIAAGGTAESTQVDALDERAVDEHLAAVVKKAGRIDVSFNAIGLVPQQGIQGIPLTELSVESFALPITTYTRAHFVTAKAAARRPHDRAALGSDSDAHAGAGSFGRTTRGRDGACMGSHGRLLPVSVGGMRSARRPRRLPALDGHPGDRNDRRRFWPSCESARHEPRAVSVSHGRQHSPTTFDHAARVGERGGLRGLRSGCCDDRDGGQRDGWNRRLTRTTDCR